MPPTEEELWRLLPWGYLLTIALETPVLMFGLSARHSWSRKLFAGVWLTAGTYPIVGILLPLTVWQWWGHTAYLIVAETFAPAAECAIFMLTYPHEPEAPSTLIRDCAAIVAANLASFLVGGYLFELMC